MLDKKNGNTLSGRQHFQGYEGRETCLQEVRKWGYCTNWIPEGKWPHNFDVNMEDFRCKARLVSGGHVTEPAATIPYASVVSRETVRIDLKLYALN